MVSLESIGGDDHTLLKKFSELFACSQLALKGVRIPVYCFGSLLDLKNVASDNSTRDSEDQSLLERLLLAQYEDHTWKNSLIYDVTACETKVTRGLRKYVVQLNEQWKPNLPLELDELQEVLFCVVTGEKPESEFIPSAMVPNGAYLITVSANPVEYGHIFLTPRSTYPLPTPQMQFASSLDMASKFAADVENSSFRVFYNCANCSTCFNAAFQACYFAAPLPVEQALALPICGVFQQTGLLMSKIAGYPMKVLLFQAKGKLETLIEMVSKICLHLIDQNTPFSLLISDCSRKIFLFPQPASFPTTDKLSACECSGHFILNNRSHYDGVSEDALEKRLAAFSIDEDGFSSLWNSVVAILPKKNCSIDQMTTTSARW